MNFPEKVKTRSVVFLLACMLIVSSVSVYYAFSASTPTSGLTDIYIEPPMMEASYVIGIYTSPSTCYLKNGTTGQITTTGTFATVLNTAITALTTGGKIFIRSGDYNLTVPVVVPIYIVSNGIWIEGEDQCSTIIHEGVGAGYPMLYYGLSSWHYLGGIKNIWFQGRNTVGSYGIKVNGYASDLIFEDCLFTNFETAMFISAYGSGVEQAKVWNIWIHRCLFEDNLKYGIWFTAANDATLRSIDRIKISECHFYNNLNSLYSNAEFVWHVTFTDNTVQAERGSCINVSNGGSGRQWIITDNHIFDCGIGANGTLPAIFVNGTTTFYPDSWLIENNIIANHFTSAPVAMNNSIWLTGTVDNFIIQGNYFYATNPVRLDGLVSTAARIIITDNSGYTTEMSYYQATCYNATWIQYNLTKPPTFISLSFNGTCLINATSFYLPPTVIAQNTTHFQIEFLFFNVASSLTFPVTAALNKTVFWTAEYMPY